MKKVFIALIGFALTFASMSVKAQVVVQDNINEGNQTSKVSPNDKDDIEQKNSSVEFDYLAVEKGYGLGVNFVFNHILLTYATTSGNENNEYLKNVSGWYIGLGYNYRYYFSKSFFIEGRAGVAYYHGSYEYKTTTSSNKTRNAPLQYGKDKTSSTKWEKESNGEVGMFISPRIGLKLFKIWGNDLNIVAGYRWDFQKFKFKKENTADYFTAGISCTF